MKTRTAVQHSDSLTLLQGGAKAPDQFEIMQTDVGARTTTGATQNIMSNATTDSTCMVGQIIKFLNLFIQTAPINTATEEDRTGWLEYALVMVKESETKVPITQLGVTTLGDVCTKMFRNECIWTGNVPIGNAQANSVALHIKVPKSKQKIRVGDLWILYLYFRDVRATSSDLDAVRTIASTIYKAY